MIAIGTSLPCGNSLILPCALTLTVPAAAAFVHAGRGGRQQQAAAAAAAATGASPQPKASPMPKASPQQAKPSPAAAAAAGGDDVGKPGRRHRCVYSLKFVRITCQGRRRSGAAHHCCPFLLCIPCVNLCAAVLLANCQCKHTIHTPGSFTTTVHLPFVLQERGCCWCTPHQETARPAEEHCSCGRSSCCGCR